MVAHHGRMTPVYIRIQSLSDKCHNILSALISRCSKPSFLSSQCYIQCSQKYVQTAQIPLGRTICFVDTQWANDTCMHTQPVTVCSHSTLFKTTISTQSMPHSKPTEIHSNCAKPVIFARLLCHGGRLYYVVYPRIPRGIAYHRFCTGVWRAISQVTLGGV